MIIPALGMAKTPEEIAKSADDLEIRLWIAGASSSDLRKYIPLREMEVQGPGDAFVKSAREELASHSHWTVIPGFVLAFIFGAIAAWPVIRGCAPVSPPAHKDSSSQLQLSIPAPATPQATKTTNVVAVP